MNYPNLLRRYVASLVDLAVIITAIYWCAKLPFYRPDSALGTAVCLAVVAIYEPLLTAYACTLGQALMRFRIRTADLQKRPGMARAYIRVSVKYALGLLSFLTLPARRDRRAVHDLAAGTIVIDAGRVAGTVT
jgi:uncharacterized RDD family membrane protein YckC